MDKKQNIAVLTSHDEGFDFEYLDLIAGLQERYNVHLVCTSSYQGQLLELDLAIHRVDCRSKLDVHAIKKIRALIKDRRIDVIYTQTNRLLAIATLSTYCLNKRPDIFVRRGICAAVHKYRLEDFLTYFSKRLNHVFTISDAAKKSLIEGGYPEEKVTTVRPALNPELFQGGVDTAVFRQNQNIPDDATVIMCIANKRFVKGLDRLLDAADRLCDKNIYWCLIGWGCDQRLLDDLKRNKPEKVRLLGFVENAYQYLDACDIYVQPSRMEGLSYSLMQAILKQKCPVICKTGGMAELIDEGINGLTFSNNENTAVNELVSHIEKLSSEPDLQNTLAINGMAKLKKDFSQQVMLEKTLKIFEQHGHNSL